ncbi:zinc finger and BTB domain-containing protein 14 isoform X7 [Eurytemora carolleeae]|uniref:zinc finger and BTB domain-containing protein 14 isoform X7 n=1 Tax=Eurytemora carolleeae TaxID=1294199 RepID=UPI000C771BC5|nr:zinc finger and BTB domain-containing protein 14 isoform X7 [Eurytemora carolleeae]|eukprot:XP_023340303.1 zinc finger and BTB domain-containing protein 14-like isoform X7 [Eurytemora affinis]
MGSSEKFCLRWNDFESNISVAFRELREEKDFFDVTLACDDSQLQAHKVILSACSPFFRNILRKNPHQHPLLYLKGVKYKELVSVLNFMYMGEVNVAQEELNSFLSVAEELRVKGLTQNNSSDSAKPEPKSRSRDPPETAPPAKKNRPSVPPPTPSQDDDIQEVIPVKSEPRDQPVPVSQELNHGYQDTGDQGTVALQENYPDDYDYEGYEGYDEGSYDPSTMQATGADGNKVCIVDNFANPGVEEHMQKTEAGWVCQACGWETRLKTRLWEHVEAKHVNTGGYTCPHCNKFCPSKNSLKAHVSRTHRGTPILNSSV